MSPIKPSNWELQHKADDPTEALFPENTSPRGLTEYVKLSFGRQSSTLVSGKRPFASGNQVYVGASVLREVPDGTIVTVAEGSKWGHLRYIFFHLPSQRLAVLGLAVALGGFVIDGGFALGKVHPFLELSTGWVFALTALGIVAKSLGSFIAFWKGIIQK